LDAKLREKQIQEQIKLQEQREKQTTALID